MSIFMGLNMSDVLNDVFDSSLILLKYYFFTSFLSSFSKVLVMDTTTALLYKFNFATIDFDRLEHGRFTYKCQEGLCWSSCFEIWSGCIYLFSCHDFIVCGSCLGEGFFWFDVIFSAKSINPIIRLTNIALWNECKTNGHFYHMVFKVDMLARCESLS